VYNSVATIHHVTLKCRALIKWHRRIITPCLTPSYY